MDDKVTISSAQYIRNSHTTAVLSEGHGIRTEVGAGPGTGCDALMKIGKDVEKKALRYRQGAPRCMGGGMAAAGWGACLL